MKAIASKNAFHPGHLVLTAHPLLWGLGGWGVCAHRLGMEPSQGWEGVPSSPLQAGTVTESQLGPQAPHSAFACLTSP